MTSLLSSRLPAELDERGLPCVLFNRSIDTEGMDSCVSANDEGGRIAARTLLELGHTAIGAIFGPVDTSTGRDRETGFRDRLSVDGANLVEARVRRGPFAYSTGYEGLHSLLDDTDPPTAVFCGNDVIAIGALNAASALGVDVPGELTILGFDDISMASWDVLRLSTLRQDLGVMARTAVGLLLERIADPERPPRRVEIPTRLILRASHSSPASTRLAGPSVGSSPDRIHTPVASQIEMPPSTAAPRR
jgi:LacI family transcriptional regulator